MESTRQQSAARFADLYRRAHLDLLRFVQRRTDHDRAEDVVAETFLVVWRRFDDTPRRHGDARAWMFGIARNLLLNEVRAGRRLEALAVKIADQPRVDLTNDELDAVTFQVDLAAAWRTLSPGEQEVLGLTVFDDLTSPQAARVLGISSPAYRLRLMRARQQLKKNLLDRSTLTREVLEAPVEEMN